MKTQRLKVVVPQTELTLLEALYEAARQNPAKFGMTAKELCEASGLHITQIRKQLAVLLREGRAITAQENRPSIAGYDRKVPVYVLKQLPGVRREGRRTPS